MSGWAHDRVRWTELFVWEAPCFASHAAFFWWRSDTPVLLQSLDRYMLQGEVGNFTSTSGSFATVLPTEYPSQQQPPTMNLKAAVLSGRTDWLLCLNSQENLHAFHTTFWMICHLQSQAGLRPEFCTVSCFYLPILGFSGNVIPLHSTAGAATDQTIFFVFSNAELVVA